MNETGEQILCALSTARKPLRCAEIAQACGRETGWGTSREIANLKRQGLIESTSHGFYAITNHGRNYLSNFYKGNQ